MQNEIKHVRLSDHTNAATKEKYSSAVNAADIVADNGGSPRAQLDAARKAVGGRIKYTPHIGKRQRERALARMEKNK